MCSTLWFSVLLFTDGTWFQEGAAAKLARAHARRALHDTRAAEKLVESDYDDEDLSDMPALSDAL